jgi:tetratricopeptide (TPR) repeat protein
VPSPLPSPSAAAKKSAPTPAAAATPAGPSPEQLRAQQVASLLGAADAALASGQFDQAIGHFDEVLRLDPGNGKATADRASAVSLRDASRKRFVAGRTVVKTEKASGGLAGFEGAEVQRTPDFSGRIEFEMSPASGLKPGDAWTLKFYLVNDGKKAIKIGGVTATTNVNGTGAGGPVAAATREVAPLQRASLGQLTGSWREGTTSWAADVLVTANKGDSLKNTLTWR